ncbi:MAG: hypothetical protein RIF33_21025 [Cyclobacteriaceae bacterium]
MKIALMVVLIFLLSGLLSLVMSIVNNAPWSIVAFQMGYLILVSAAGYIAWKKYRNA